MLSTFTTAALVGFLLSIVNATDNIADINFPDDSSYSIAFDHERLRRDLSVADSDIRLEETNHDVPLEAKSRGASRDRRNVFLDLPQTHLEITTLQASQRCKGILLEWTQPNIPDSPQFPYENSEFSYYKVYRTSNYVASTIGLKPYASGTFYADLRNLSHTEWLDRDPLPNQHAWYAVTITTEAGKEYDVITPAKIMFIGAFGATGGRIPLTPSQIGGKVLNHAAAYNHVDDRYLIVFDVDKNDDGRPDRLFALQINQQGKITNGNILDMSANIQGVQGWPQAAYNPTSNEYLVTFRLMAPTMFDGKAILISQRIKTVITQRVNNPALSLKANDNRRGKLVPIHLDNHQLSYNPATAGYTTVTEMIAPDGKRGVIIQGLDPHAKALPANIIANTKVNGRNGRAFLDTKRNEMYVAMLIPSASINNRKLSEPFVYIVTKVNATGKPLGPSPIYLVAGTTNLLYSTLTGFYSAAKDRVVLYWDAIEKGNNVVRQATVLISPKSRIEGLYNEIADKGICQEASKVRKPFAAHLDEINGAALIWEEQQSMRWRINGPLIKDGTFQFTGNQQRNPILVPHPGSSKVLVMWQESLSASRIVVFAQFIQRMPHQCSAGCLAKEVCLRENTCVASYKAQDPCRLRNGGCSHVCLKSPSGAVCACPAGKVLLRNKKDCTDQGLQISAYSIIIAANQQIWHMIKYQDGAVRFQLLPISGQSFVAMDYDDVNKQLYYSDVDAKMIMRTDITGKNTGSFLSTGTVDGLAIDDKLQKLYWSDMATKTIEVINLDRTGRKTLVSGGLEKPRAIKLLQSNGKTFIYWTDWGSTPRVERAELYNRGTMIRNRQTLVSSDLQWPNGIALDARRMIVGDAGKDKIESFDLLGKNRRLITKLVEHPFEVKIVNGSLYWSDWSGNLLKKPLSGGAQVPIISHLKRPAGFVIISGHVSMTKSCPAPGTPSNGRIVGSSFTAGRSVSFECLAGYTLVGPVSIRCLSSGAWSSQQFPICTRVACVRPARPRNGNIYITGTSSGDSVVHTCNPGYNMAGSRVRMCQDDGLWSGDQARCLVLPVFTKRPQNHTIAVGKSVVLRCDSSGEGITFQWRKNNRALSPSDSDSRVFIFQRSIVLSEIRFSDAAIFTCTVSNDIGSISSSATVNVLGNQVAKCGKQKFSTRPRISGGRIAGDGSHPWIAMLVDNRRKKMFCGGSLIAERWILTAAHCLENIVNPKEFVVLLGKSRLLKDDPNQQKIAVKAIYKHSAFSIKTYDSDIALLELAKPALITDYVSPICLPFDDLDFKLVDTLTLVTIAGWGSKNERQVVSEKLSKKLREIEVPIVGHGECQSKMSHPITKNMVCAGDRSGTDACKGDSGGPMEGRNYKTKKHVLVGVVSWGEGCGRTDTYGIYTKVQNYLAWISSHMDK